MFKLSNATSAFVAKVLNRNFHLQCQKLSTKAPYIADFRSDTLSLQTEEMRKAMATAPVGDDSYKEDPTVNELEAKVAKMTGKEAALYVTSGTMGNLIAIMLHCSRRDSEIIVGDDCHIHISEQGGIAQLASVHSRTVKTNRDGMFDLQEVKDKIREKNNMHYPITQLLCLENTHNRCGGTVLPLDYHKQAYELCQASNVPLHIDGARVTNAAVKLNVPLSDITQYCDTITFCFSKGLGAPVGSILCGPKDLIKRAIFVRKVLGGGVRQSGFLAAAALQSLETMQETLSNDHRNAFKLAQNIHDAQSKAVKIDLNLVHTNIVLVEMDPAFITPEQFCQRMATVPPEEKESLGEEIIVKMRPYGKNRARLVLCRNNTDEDIEKCGKKIKYVLSKI